MQKLYLVMGGELADLTQLTFKKPHDLDVVGIFADYSEAEKVWRAHTQRTVDNAEMRYLVVPLHDHMTKILPSQLCRQVSK